MAQQVRAIVTRGIGRTYRIGAAALCLAVLTARAADGQDLALPPEQHAWASFPVGSWKLVRTVSESHGANGKVEITTTDVKTTLVAVDASSCTLRTETTLETGGRRLPVQSQTQQFGFYGTGPGQSVEVVRTGTSSVVIAGKTIPCEVRQLTIASDNSRSTSMLHYSSEVPPYILRRETTNTTTIGDKETELKTTVNVVSLDLPVRVGQHFKQAIYMMTKQQLPAGERTVLEVEVLEVPGWVVSHAATERDAEGRLLRRSTLELIDYGLPIMPSAQGQVGKIPAPQPNTDLRNRRQQRRAARRTDDPR